MRPYWLLRGKMFEKDVKGYDIANLLGCGNGYVSERLTGKRSFTIEEAYKILDYLDLPAEDIFTYFPPNKGETKPVRRGA